MELPRFYIKAAICAEDHRFKDHCGIDPLAVARAAWTDIKAGAFVEGESTITQQLVKNLLFTEDKKMERKAAEVFAAAGRSSKCTISLLSGYGQGGGQAAYGPGAGKYGVPEDNHSGRGRENRK